MKTYPSHQPAPYGIYVSLRPPDMRYVGPESRVLRGRISATYVRVPALLTLLLAPVVGGAFALAFPIVIFAALLDSIPRKIAQMARAARARARRENRSAWSPRTRQAGLPAPYGLYLSAWPPSGRFVGADGEELKGRIGRRYLRVPTLLVLLAAPVFGGLFVLTFPVVFVVLLAGVAFDPVATWTRGFVERSASLASVRWEPVAAYLTNVEQRTDEEAGVSVHAGDVELESLEEEVRARQVEERSHDPSPRS